MSEQTPDPVERLAQILRDHPAGLSDVRRERGAQALVARLERQAGTVVDSTPARKSPRPMVLASLGLLAAAASLIFALTPHPPRPTGPVAKPTPEGPTPERPAPAAAARADLALLRLANAGERETGRVRLESRGGEEIRAVLADCGRIVLRGDSELAVEENAASAISLRLIRGTVVVSFDHDSGRGLTVRTRDAVVRVTGTVFAVGTGEGPTRVSVSVGSVEVAANGLPVSVTAGKSWQVGAPSLGTPETSIALAMRELRSWDSPGPAAPARPPRRNAAAPPKGEESWPAPAVPVVPARPDPAENPNPAEGSHPAEGLYRAAENALSGGQSGLAKRLLRELLAQYPRDPLAAPAAYELGRLAFADHDCRQARDHLQAVRDSAETAARPFRDPATFLLCRCEVDSGRRAAALACLDRFRADFPDSPHHGSVLALLATLYAESQDCARGTPIIVDYLRRFPAGAHAARLRSLAKACAPGPPGAVGDGGR